MGICGTGHDTSQILSSNGGRRAQTLTTDNSSITGSHINNYFNYEDECKIVMHRFNKQEGGKIVRYIEAVVTLFEDNVDEMHDLFYLVKLPDPKLDRTGSGSIVASHT